MKQIAIRFFGALALGLCAALPAQAGSFAVAPVRVEIAAPRRAAAIEIENTGDRPAQVQVERFLWAGHDARGDKLVPTEDFVVTPPIVQLAPGQRQIMRLMFLTPLDPRREATYRMILQEVPTGDAAANTVATVLRISLPVFVTPPGAKSEIEWSLAGEDKVLVARNRGNAHVHLQEVARDAGDKLPPVGYLLPGETREWAIAGPPPERVRFKTSDGQEVLSPVGR